MRNLALTIIAFVIFIYLVGRSKKESFFELGWDGRNRQISMIPIKPPSKPFLQEDAEELSDGFPLRAIPGTRLVCRLEPK